MVGARLLPCAVGLGVLGLAARADKRRLEVLHVLSAPDNMLPYSSLVKRAVRQTSAYSLQDRRFSHSAWRALDLASKGKKKKRPARLALIPQSVPISAH